ncbi:MAG: hypothetical protein P8N09_06750 [Planctomycetota bacterium]|nr:hypothetical protein [Planctomycetota bacterium]
MSWLAGCASHTYKPIEPDWQGRVAELLEAWPVSTYTVLDRGQPVGRMTLRQSLQEEAGERFVLMEDAARVVDPTGEAELVDYAFISRCRLDDHFTPQVVEGQLPARTDTPANSRVEISEGWARGTTFESEVDLQVPERFLIRQGLMRLAGLLPREVGSETQLTFLSLGAHPAVEKGRSVRCSGCEELEIEGQRVKAWRFEYETAERGKLRSVSLWVGEEGRLLRFHDEQGLQLELRRML